jgi:hypothetical protein
VSTTDDHARLSSSQGSSSAADRLPIFLPSLHRRHAQPRPRAFVLFDPDGAFAAVAARPRPLVAMLVLCAFALLPPLSFVAKANQVGGMRAVLVDEMKKSGAWEKIQAMPAEQRERVLRASAPAMTVALPLGAVGKRCGWLLLVAVGCFVLVRHTSQRPIGLFDIVGVVAVGAAPLAVHDLLTAVSLLMHDLRAIDPQNAVMSNPAALFFDGREARTALAMALRGVDVFELHACWLMGLGVVQLTHTRSVSPWLVSFGGHVVATVVAALTAKAAG